MKCIRTAGGVKAHLTLVLEARWGSSDASCPLRVLWPLQTPCGLLSHFSIMARGRSGKGKAGVRRSGDGSTGTLRMLQDAAPLFKVPSNLVHNFVRTYDYGTLSVAAADQGYGFDFTLQSLPVFGDFTSLYDAYCIDRVEVTWELSTIGTGATQSSSIMPIILAWPDYDNATAPSLSSAQQVSQLERLNLSEAKPSVRRSIVPRVTLGTAGAAANSGVTSRPNQWVDMAYPAVNHYGVKFFVKNLNTLTVASTGATVAVSFRYHFRCRNPR